MPRGGIGCTAPPLLESSRNQRALRNALCGKSQPVKAKDYTLSGVLYVDIVKKNTRICSRIVTRNIVSGADWSARFAHMTPRDRRVTRMAQSFRLWRNSGSNSALRLLVDSLTRRCRAAERLDIIAVRGGVLTELQRLERKAGRELLRFQIKELVERAVDGWERTRFVDILESYTTNVERQEGDLRALRYSV